MRSPLFKRLHEKNFEKKPAEKKKLSCKKFLKERVRECADIFLRAIFLKNVSARLNSFFYARINF